MIIMHATTLAIIYNYVLFGFRSNIIFHPIILYDLQYSILFVYLICDLMLMPQLTRMHQCRLIKENPIGSQMT